MPENQGINTGNELIVLEHVLALGSLIVAICTGQRRRDSIQLWRTRLYSGYSIHYSIPVGTLRR